MGVVEIFRGMGKSFRVCSMLFIYSKVISKISAPEVSIIHFLGCCDWGLIQPCIEVDTVMCQPSGTHNIIKCGFSISYLSIFWRNQKRVGLWNPSVGFWSFVWKFTYLILVTVFCAIFSYLFLMVGISYYFPY